MFLPVKLAQAIQDLVSFGGHKAYEDICMVATMRECGREVHVGEKSAKCIQADQSVKILVPLSNIGFQ